MLSPPSMLTVLIFMLVAIRQQENKTNITRALRPLETIFQNLDSVELVPDLISKREIRADRGHLAAVSVSYAEHSIKHQDPLLILCESLLETFFRLPKTGRHALLPTLSLSKVLAII